ncbi:MAG: class I SAM-dependent RNA methyltransferase, partial [Trebonia sp.]
MIEVMAVDVAQGGWCVARPEGEPVVFLRHALPGERVRARVTEVTARFARADAVEILDPSPDRVQAPCPSARPGGCGGCDWQHASLPAQRGLKATVITQHLRRLAGVDLDVTVEPLPGDEDDGSAGSVASADPGTDASTDSVGDNSKKRQPGFGWRTRVQFAVRDDGLAGLRGHRSHEVVDVGDCLIAHPAIRELGIPRLRWDGAAGVEALTSGDESAVIVTEDDDRRGGRRPSRRAGAWGSGGGSTVRSAKAIPEGATAVTAQTVLSRAGRRVTPVRGRPYLTRHAAGREWRVSAGSFWQVHPAAADTLVAAVVGALEPRPG